MRTAVRPYHAAARRPRPTQAMVPVHSELRFRDVRNLLQCVESLDWSYLERWAPEISVSGLLSEVRS